MRNNLYDTTIPYHTLSVALSEIEKQYTADNYSISKFIKEILEPMGVVYNSQFGPFIAGGIVRRLIKNESILKGDIDIWNSRRIILDKRMLSKDNLFYPIYSLTND